MALFVQLDEMPFDRWDSEGHSAHATGFAIVEADGNLTYTYEGDYHAEPSDDDDIVITMDAFLRWEWPV